MVPVWLEFCATKAHFQIILVVPENGFSIDILSLNVNFTFEYSCSNVIVAWWKWNEASWNHL